MEKLFNRILVPIALNNDSHATVTQAVEIARRLNCDLHLVHANSTSLFDFLKVTTIRKRNAVKKVNLSSIIENNATKLEKGKHIYSRIIKGSTSDVIPEYALAHGIDLIIMGNDVNNSAFPLFKKIDISRLSRKTNCPVLTVNNSPSAKDPRIIVIPVSETFSIRKIMIATYLAKAFDASIHLVSLSALFDRKTSYLFKTFNLLKESTNLSVQCKPVQGNNIADSTLEYAKTINADLIVINPGQESQHSGILNRFFSNYIGAGSKIRVVTVA